MVATVLLSLLSYYVRNAKSQSVTTKAKGKSKGGKTKTIFLPCDAIFLVLGGWGGANKQFLWQRNWKEEEDEEEWFVSPSIKQYCRGGQKSTKNISKNINENCIFSLFGEFLGFLRRNIWVEVLRYVALYRYVLVWFSIDIESWKSSYPKSKVDFIALLFLYSTRILLLNI